MYLCVLGSGSKGNCIFVNSGKRSLLVDAGLSWKHINEVAKVKGISLSTVTKIIITHEHTDHWKNAFYISNKLGDIPVFFQKHARKSLLDRWGDSDWGSRILTEDAINSIQSFDHGITGKTFTIESFITSHDTAYPLGFVITENSTLTKIGIATDLGIVTKIVLDALIECDLIVLEANHDPQMLIDGTYPEHIKTRVLGRSGHLSNEQAAKLINLLDQDRTKHVVLGHISEDNNSVEKIEETFNNILSTRHPMIHLATQTKGSSVFCV